MRRNAKAIVTSLSLGVLAFASGCVKCIDVKGMPEAPPQTEIVRKGVVVKAAIQSSGDPGILSVEDYTLPYGDGVREIKVGGSEPGVASHASINFPRDQFGAGPAKVEVKAFHYNNLRLEAYDADGRLVDSAEHTAGQDVTQTLTLGGGPISRVDIIGTEIGIVDICYEQ
jgi:hypothetical protein